MIDYKKSGVDIQAGDQLVEWLQGPLVKSTASSDDLADQLNQIKINSDVPDYKKRVVSGIGGFAALFDGRFSQMKKPLLVSCTDGVGTKVKVASYFQDFSRVGQDLVAMCANDLICTGGTPLFFLDYYAVGKLNLENAQSFLKGVRVACEQSHMVLIGGETAEMPGVYQTDDFDCAGFSVGVVDEEKMWGAHRVQDGDVILGIESSGFHSNGYSLIRRVFENEFDQYKSWLLEPTRLYVQAALALKEAHILINAAAHMTGGGIENLPRVLPDHLKAVVKNWEMPECFKEVQRRAKLSDQQMKETFNCGIGFCLVLPESQVKQAQIVLAKHDYVSQYLGFIQSRNMQEPHFVWQ